VGDDAYAVVSNADGAFLPELDLGEPDTCGGSRFACGGSRFVYSDIDQSRGIEYICLECGYEAPVFITIAERAVSAVK